MASGVLSIVPFVVTGIVAAWLASPAEQRASAVMQGALSGVALTIAVTGMNMVVGTAPAGALGALIVAALHLLRAGRNQNAAALEPVGRKALSSYVLLLGGVLVAGWGVRWAGLPENWRYLASPALWLFVAAAWFARGLPDGQAARRAWKAWGQVAPITGLFITLGILMAVSGMAEFLARALAAIGPAYLPAAPFLGAVGGFVTGSNTGANAMFATTQAEIARSLGVNLLWFMAVHNVAAAFLLLASPSKVEMAIQLTGSAAADQRRWIQITVLWVSLIVVGLLALINTLGIGGYAAHLLSK